MERRKITVSYRFVEKIGNYVATSPEVKGFIAQGKTVEELLDRIPRVLARFLRSCGETIEKVNVTHEAAKGKMASRPSPKGLRKIRKSGGFVTETNQDNVTEMSVLVKAGRGGSFKT